MNKSKRVIFYFSMLISTTIVTALAFLPAFAVALLIHALLFKVGVLTWSANVWFYAIVLGISSLGFGTIQLYYTVKNGEIK